jgi:hypothetical protein
MVGYVSSDWPVFIAIQAYVASNNHHQCTASKWCCCQRLILTALSAERKRIEVSIVYDANVRPTACHDDGM